jgi:hypothetical protein
MGRLEVYRQAIHTILAEHSKSPPINGDIESQIIWDSQNDHYLLIYLGWTKYYRSYNCVIHFDIIDGKIWIQRNQTEEILAEALMELGVAKDEIVIGLKSESMRPYTGYAIA